MPGLYDTNDLANPGNRTHLVIVEKLHVARGKLHVEPVLSRFGQCLEQIQRLDLQRRERRDLRKSAGCRQEIAVVNAQHPAVVPGEDRLRVCDGSQ